MQSSTSRGRPRFRGSFKRSCNRLAIRGRTCPDRRHTSRTRSRRPARTPTRTPSSSRGPLHPTGLCSTPLPRPLPSRTRLAARVRRACNCRRLGARARPPRNTKLEHASCVTHTSCQQLRQVGRPECADRARRPAPGTARACGKASADRVGLRHAAFCSECRCDWWRWGLHAHQVTILHGHCFTRGRLHARRRTEHLWRWHPRPRRGLRRSADGCDADCHLTATPAWTVTRGDPNILVTVPIDVAVGPDGQIVVLGSGAGPPIPMGRAGWSRLTPAAPSGGSGMSRAESAMRSPLADRR